MPWLAGRPESLRPRGMRFSPLPVETRLASIQVYNPYMQSVTKHTSQCLSSSCRRTATALVLRSHRGYGSQPCSRPGARRRGGAAYCEPRGCHSATGGGRARYGRGREPSSALARDPCPTETASRSDRGRAAGQQFCRQFKLKHNRPRSAPRSAGHEKEAADPFGAGGLSCCGTGPLATHPGFRVAARGQRPRRPPAGHRPSPGLSLVRPPAAHPAAGFGFFFSASASAFAAAMSFAAWASAAVAAVA